MKVGILELREYQFINDVAKKLDDLGVEFINIAELDMDVHSKYRVIIDRLSFQEPYLRQMLMLASLNGTYVLNNPFSSTINNKVSIHKVAESIGIKQPKTLVLPRMTGEWELGELVKDPSWPDIKKKIEFPCILKPFDGFAWENVYEIASFRELDNMYNALKERHIMLLQEKIEYTEFFRVFCVNKKDVLIAKWVPKPMGLGQYMQPDPKTVSKFGEKITELTIKLNRLIDFDFNAVEWCIDDGGELFVIDAMNEVPDVDKKFMPEEYYWWIVDKFCACVRDKMSPEESNRNMFHLHHQKK
jgi:hypothetical protein